MFQVTSIVSKYVKQLKAVQNFIYPYACLKCQTHLDDFSGLCHICAQHLDYIAKNYCNHCGYPFDLSIGSDILCAKCLQNPPLYTKARSIFYYQDGIKPLILKLKYADAHHIVPFLGEQMLIYMKIHALNPDYIIPVPSHYRRLWFRMYNQTALLADYIVKSDNSHHLKPLMQGLKRVKYNTQKDATRLQREQNLKNAFICPNALHDRIKGKNILLIDDVMTSGATINACTKALLKAKPHSIHVLTLARVTMQTHNLEIDF
ncbi:MAG: ComF family protein [Alphaproteobacteria bacterium]|jgi:ComF family protein